MHISSIASLPPPQRNKALESLSEADADQLLHRWDFMGRLQQQAPPGDWRVWLFLAGRGAGKTRAGAEWVRGQVKAGCHRIALIAPTAAAARDVMVEGEGGILSVCWEHDRDDVGNPMGRPHYEPSKRRLTWANGATGTLFSAEEPERLRGPQHDAMWCDELAAWREAQAAWDMAMFGLRLGSDPRAMVSTTPKPLPLIRELIRSPDCAVTRASSYDNRAHLAPAFFSQIIAKYEGTRLGRQELNAELIEEADGALWTRDMIRLAERLPDMARIVVAIDPATTANKDSALTGIVVAGLGADGNGYVLDDLSGRYSPNGWALRAVQAYDDFKADRIIAEGNQGGEMVRHTLQTERPNAPVQIVHASRGKAARAEPVAALYEQAKVFHAKPFPELDDQLCTWEPLSGQASPDRLDALVWALTALMVGRPQEVSIGMPVSIKRDGSIEGASTTARTAHNSPTALGVAVANTDGLSAGFSDFKDI